LRYVMTSQTCSQVTSLAPAVAAYPSPIHGSGRSPRLAFVRRSASVPSTEHTHIQEDEWTPAWAFMNASALSAESNS
jgi:hypothetical protein